MGKTTIIEAQNSDTVYEQGSKGILGKLKGVFADYKHGTRNSDRLYSEELWDNRVFGSEDVMEALETKTLFGELDHPEGDRCETLAKNAAITITKLEKRPEEGVIYGEAEILDTPTGRIVKALADSGAKLGVSSRGMGEEVFVDGQNIIDPETYDFITFDVVVTPANTKARVELTESKQISKLTENLKKEISEVETENQLNQIRTVLESVSLSNKEELENLIENKANTFIKEIPNKLTEANKGIALKILKQKYEESNQQLEEAIKSSDKLAEENAKLIEQNEFLKKSRGKMRVKLGEQRNLINKNNSTDNKMNKRLSENKKIIEGLKLSLKLENSKHKEMLLKMRTLSNKKVESVKAQYNQDIKEMKENLNNLQTEKDNLQEKLNLKDVKINKLLESVKIKQAKLDKCKDIITENKELKEKVLKLENAQKEHQAKLTESKLQETKKIRALEARIKELEENKSKMEETQNRFSKLAFDPVGTVRAVAENFINNDLDQEDIDLFNALTGKNN